MCPAEGEEGLTAKAYRTSGQNGEIVMSRDRDKRNGTEDRDFDQEDPCDGELVYEACFEVIDGIGSGSSCVYHHRGKYYHITAEQQGEAVDSLESAIRDGAGEINDCCSWITCPSVSAAQLVTLLTVCDSSAHV